MILYDFDAANRIEKIIIPCDTNIKAGTPMDRAGNICNDANAVGILLGDVVQELDSVQAFDGKRYANGVLLTAGYVDKNYAQEHSGITYSDAAIAALTGITFVDRKLAEYTLPAASTNAIGGVKLGAAVADATEGTVVTQLNALIASLEAAGVIAGEETE